ncbi:MAG: hypothetical protein AAGA56_24480 [Myxococcota bacterium]
MSWSALAGLAEGLAKSGVDNIVVPYQGKSDLEAPTGEAAEHWKSISKPRDPAGPATVLEEGLDKKKTRLDEKLESCLQVKAAINQGIKAGQSMSPAEVREIYASAFVAGLRACRCKTDPDEVRAWMWTRMDRYWNPPVWTLTLPLAAPNPGSEAVRVTLPATTPWKEASRSLYENRGAERVALQVAP